jgi:hypothetical protein
VTIIFLPLSWEGSLIGDPEGCVNEGSGNGRRSPYGPAGGPVKGRCCTEDFHKKVIFCSIWRPCLLGYAKKIIETGNSHHRCPVGDPGRGPFIGDSER